MHTGQLPVVLYDNYEDPTAELLFVLDPAELKNGRLEKALAYQTHHATSVPEQQLVSMQYIAGN